jgi:hypothetical protein
MPAMRLLKRLIMPLALRHADLTQCLNFRPYLRPYLRRGAPDGEGYGHVFHACVFAVFGRIQSLSVEYLLLEIKASDESK